MFVLVKIINVLLDLVKVVLCFNILLFFIIKVVLLFVLSL